MSLSNCEHFDIKQARPLLEEYAIDELIDPSLGNRYSEHEVYCMLHAASLCIRREPHSRPRMSQVKEVFQWMFFTNFFSFSSTPKNLLFGLWTCWYYIHVQ